VDDLTRIGEVDQSVDVGEDGIGVERNQRGNGELQGGEGREADTEACKDQDKPHRVAGNDAHDEAQRRAGLNDDAGRDQPEDDQRRQHHGFGPIPAEQGEVGLWCDDCGNRGIGRDRQRQQGKAELSPRRQGGYERRHACPSQSVRGISSAHPVTVALKDVDTHLATWRGSPAVRWERPVLNRL
jgi:hypothetical protein